MGVVAQIHGSHSWGLVFFEGTRVFAWGGAKRKPKEARHFGCSPILRQTLPPTILEADDQTWYGRCPNFLQDNNRLFLLRVSARPNGSSVDRTSNSFLRGRRGMVQR